MPLSDEFLGVIEDSLGVQSHYDLLSWLQGAVQEFLPHEILLAAWGDPSLGVFYIDVTSHLEATRTTAVIQAGIRPFVHDLLKKWKASKYVPCFLAAPRGFTAEAKPGMSPSQHSFGRMRNALVHGIRNHRDKQLCLYAIFSSEAFPPFLARNMEILLPHIDAALRQIEHLPAQRGKESAVPQQTLPDELALSGREADIVLWVAAGKTNHEIALIMDISPFTVKNHLRRIFRKLNVSNRAQAVDKLSRQKMARSVVDAQPSGVSGGSSGAMLPESRHH